MEFVSGTPKTKTERIVDPEVYLNYFDGYMMQIHYNLCKFWGLL